MVLYYTFSLRKDRDDKMIIEYISNVELTHWHVPGGLGSMVGVDMSHNLNVPQSYVA